MLGFWIVSFPGYTQQTDSVYCLPIGKARLLVADAMKLRLSEELLTTSQQRVELLESERIAAHKAFTNLLKIERDKYTMQKEITADVSRLSDSWREEATYFQKRSKKFRRQRDGLALGIVGVLILMVIK